MREANGLRTLIETYEQEDPDRLDEFRDDQDFSSCLCPITRDIMRNPVICPDGQTFDRDAIMPWIERQHASPISMRRLDAHQLVRNMALEHVIEARLRRGGRRNEAEAQLEIERLREQVQTGQAAEITLPVLIAQIEELQNENAQLKRENEQQRAIINRFTKQPLVRG